jgi:hypothetical protein
MTVREFAEKNGYRIATDEMAALDQPIRGVYACDLLSWAMAKVSAGDVWTTVHTNLNVVAVASLTGAACVVIPEGVDIEAPTLARANREDVPMLSAPHSAAEICLRVHRALAGDVLPG